MIIACQASPLVPATCGAGPAGSSIDGRLMLSRMCVLTLFAMAAMPSPKTVKTERTSALSVVPSERCCPLQTAGSYQSGTKGRRKLEKGGQQDPTQPQVPCN